MCVSPQLALPDLRGGSHQQLAGFLGIFSYRSSPTITTRVESKSNTLGLVVLGLCQRPAEVELDGSVGWNQWGGPSKPELGTVGHFLPTASCRLPLPLSLSLRMEGTQAGLGEFVGSQEPSLGYME